ncbi:hypothetical protein [Burkholderia vietnamiensis]|uniref:hypothetical protein n=1 Tax=Burkholderia vietnamiensis TaxID=60552 RepID=UPI001594422E|nr:hypothetical protein [Burkholderia vietnamiensis]
MFDFNLPPLIQIPATALASALMTTYLQTRDHRYRKHWEMKVQAYRDLIDGLSGIEQYYDAHERSIVSAFSMDHEMQVRLDEKLVAGEAEVRRAALTGPFLFSAEVEAALREYLKPRPQVADWYVRVEKEGAAIAVCRRRVVELATQDLELTAPLLYRARKLASRVSKRLQIHL